MAAPAKSISPVVLVHGDDDFGVQQRAKQLYLQWSAELGGMDHEVIDAGVSNSGEALKALSRLRESLQTLPFFGTGKAIWFQNCSFLGDDRTGSASAVTSGLTALSQELKEVQWKSIRLVISAVKVDRRKIFYKTIDKLGAVESFTGLSLDDRDWMQKAETHLLQCFKEWGNTISDEALAELVSCVGPNLRQLNSEAEKLSLFVGQRKDIEVADVTTICTRNKSAKAFALGDALGNRDLPKLLRTLDEELWEMQFDKQKSEIGILYGLISKVRAMILLKEMVREGWIKPEGDYNRFKSALERIPADQLPDDKRFNPLANNPYVLFKALPQVRRYTQSELVGAMDTLLQCNRRLVSSGLDEALILQQALVQIVGQPGQKHPG